LLEVLKDLGEFTQVYSEKSLIVS